MSATSESRDPLEVLVQVRNAQVCFERPPRREVNPMLFVELACPGRWEWCRIEWDCPICGARCFRAGGAEVGRFRVRQFVASTLRQGTCAACGDGLGPLGGKP